MKQKSFLNSSIQKAFKIIEYVSGFPQGIRLVDISKHLSFNKATALRMLSTLEEIGVLNKKEGRYFLGLKLYELGNKVSHKKVIVDKVHKKLESIVKDLNETVNFGVLFENKVLYLDKIESNRSLQINTTIGGKISLHCTALGKSILSILSDEELESLLDCLDLEKKTKNTIDNKKLLLEEIKKTKERGYSVDDEEFEEGLRCVAVPLKFKDINFYGAISVSGPISRFTKSFIPELGEKLRIYAKIIEKEVEMT